MRCAPPSERGFALPAVIFLVALLTLLLSAGLTRVEVDREIAHASEATTVALAVAHSGLQQYLGGLVTPPPDGDSVRVNVTGGYANVIAYLVRRPADSTAPQLYFIRSVGFAIEPAAGASPTAQRTVAQFAAWQPGAMKYRGALTAAAGVQEHIGSADVTISGYDACGTQGPIPGVRTTYVSVPTPAPSMTFTGSPGLIEEGAGTDPTIAWQTGIDWAGATGGAITPDYTTFQQGDFSFPVQVVAGSLTLTGTSTGTGLLIVPGDLTISGSFFYFEGVVLVGGRIDFGAEFNQVRGLVVTGLNAQLGLSPAKTHVGGSGSGVDKDLYLFFDSCKIALALAPLTGMAPVQNAWTDNVASY